MDRIEIDPYLVPTFIGKEGVNINKIKVFSKIRIERIHGFH